MSIGTLLRHFLTVVRIGGVLSVFRTILEKILVIVRINGVLSALRTVLMSFPDVCQDISCPNTVRISWPAIPGRYRILLRQILRFSGKMTS